MRHISHFFFLFVTPNQLFTSSFHSFSLEALTFCFLLPTWHCIRVCVCVRVCVFFLRGGKKNKECVWEQGRGERARKRRALQWQQSWHLIRCDQESWYPPSCDFVFDVIDVIDGWLPCRLCRDWRGCQDAQRCCIEYTDPRWKNSWSSQTTCLSWKERGVGGSLPLKWMLKANTESEGPVGEGQDIRLGWI